MQIHIGVLAVVLKIDIALASLLDWPTDLHIPWETLREKYHFPKIPKI